LEADNVEKAIASAGRRRKRILKRWFIRCVILLALVVATTRYLVPKILDFMTHASTDNAYVAGTIIPVSAEVQGRVVKVYVEDNQAVKAGDPLVEIDDEYYSAVVERSRKALLSLMAEEEESQASLKERREALSEARAEFESKKVYENLASKEEKRYADLVKHGRVSDSQYDHLKSEWLAACKETEAAGAGVSRAEANIRSLEAKLQVHRFKIEEAKVILELARLNLRKTRITAPIAGRIAKKNVDPGKYVQPGQPLLSILDEKDIWVIANFKETQIEKMRIGQPVKIEVDAYPGNFFHGHIDSFQPGTGAVFSLLPPENATGNFVKVVQRVPVKIVLDSPRDPNFPLWPGLSVIPHVDLREGNAKRPTGTPSAQADVESTEHMEGRQEHR